VAILAREAAQVRHLVGRSCRLKADIVEKDEREVTGLRAILNYGHTFAHAFETVAGYGTWLHGEAVAAGMMCAARLACLLGMIDVEVADRQEKLLLRFGLPVRPEAWSVDEILKVMRRDKKAAAGRLRFVLLRAPGIVEVVENVDERQVEATLQKMMGP
jgi:3-dehydroquinate synthase